MCIQDINKLASMVWEKLDPKQEEDIETVLDNLEKKWLKEYPHHPFNRDKVRKIVEEESERESEKIVIDPSELEEFDYYTVRYKSSIMAGKIITAMLLLFVLLTKAF